jgi:uncharacterized protein (UPF0216 family)
MKTLCVHENGSAVVYLDPSELERLNQSLDKNEIETLSECIIFRIDHCQRMKDIYSDKSIGLFSKTIEILDADIEMYQRLNNKLSKLLEAKKNRGS